MYQYTTYSALLDLAGVLGDVYNGAFDAINSGSFVGATTITTSIGDSSLPFMGFKANYFKNGIVFMGDYWSSGINGYAITVGSSTDTTGSHIPFLKPISRAVTVSDTHNYSIVDGAYPLYVLVSALNKALMEIGPIVKTEVIDVVEDQESYDVSGYRNLIKIEVSTGSAAPYEYVQNNHWHIVEPEAPDARQIEFDPGFLPSGTNMKIRVTYEDFQTPLFSSANQIFSTEIDPQINPERLKWNAAVHAVNWRYQRVGKQDPGLVDLFNRCSQMAAQMNQRYPMKKRMIVHLMHTRNASVYLDSEPAGHDINKVRL